MTIAHRLHVTIGPDHRLDVRLPDEVPAGPAEVIVISTAQDTEEETLSEAQQRAVERVLGRPRAATPAGTPTTLEMLREDRSR